MQKGRRSTLCTSELPPVAISFDDYFHLDRRPGAVTGVSLAPNSRPGSPPGGVRMIALPLPLPLPQLDGPSDRRKAMKKENFKKKKKANKKKNKKSNDKDKEPQLGKAEDPDPEDEPDDDYKPEDQTVPDPPKKTMESTETFQIGGKVKDFEIPEDFSHLDTAEGDDDDDDSSGSDKTVRPYRPGAKDSPASPSPSVSSGPAEIILSRCAAHADRKCVFILGCCVHKLPDLECTCPPRWSCCCHHHRGDCCYCLSDLSEKKRSSGISSEAGSGDAKGKKGSAGEEDDRGAGSDDTKDKKDNTGEKDDREAGYDDTKDKKDTTGEEDDREVKSDDSKDKKKKDTTGEEDDREVKSDDSKDKKKKDTTGEEDGREADDDEWEEAPEDEQDAPDNPSDEKNTGTDADAAVGQETPDETEDNTAMHQNDDIPEGKKASGLEDPFKDPDEDALEEENAADKNEFDKLELSETTDWAEEMDLEEERKAEEERKPEEKEAEEKKPEKKKSEKKKAKEKKAKERKAKEKKAKEKKAEEKKAEEKKAEEWSTDEWKVEEMPDEDPHDDRVVGIGKHMRNMLDSGQFSDMIVSIGSKTKFFLPGPFKVHRVVMYRSPLVSRFLDATQSYSGRVEIHAEADVNFCFPQVFKPALSYIYSELVLDYQILRKFTLTTCGYDEDTWARVQFSLTAAMTDIAICYASCGAFFELPEVVDAGTQLAISLLSFDNIELMFWFALHISKAAVILDPKMHPVSPASRMKRTTPALRPCDLHHNPIQTMEKSVAPLLLQSALDFVIHHIDENFVLITDAASKGVMDRIPMQLRSHQKVKESNLGELPQNHALSVLLFSLPFQSLQAIFTALTKRGVLTKGLAEKIVGEREVRRIGALEHLGRQNDASFLLTYKNQDVRDLGFREYTVLEKASPDTGGQLLYQVRLKREWQGLKLQ